MDLLNITSHMWNIFLLFLLLLPGSILESIDKNSTTKGPKKNTQLDLKSINSMQTFSTMSSTAPATFSTALTATIPTKILLSLKKTTAATKSIKLFSSEKREQNYTTTKQEEQHNHYKKYTKLAKNTTLTGDNSHEIHKNYTTTASTEKITKKHADEQEKQEKQSELFLTDLHNKSYEAQKHFQPVKLHNITNTLRHNDKALPTPANATKTILERKLFLSQLKQTKINITSTLATAFTSNPFVTVYQKPHLLGKLAISNSTRINEMYINDPDIILTKGNNILQRNDYNGSGQTANTLSTAAILINSFNKSNQATAISTMTISTTTTTKKPSALLTTKQNHMYDNNSALSYLPYKSAALKASATDMKTMNDNNNKNNKYNNLYMHSSSSGNSLSSNIKRDTLLSSNGILTTVKPAVVDNSFMKNSTSNIFVRDEDDDDDGEKILNIQHNFKSNNSSEHQKALAMQQTSKTITTPKPTTTTIKINETSSSLTFNVSSTFSVISAATTRAKETPTPATTSSTTTAKTTLKTTTRRRTTTLKPPPTIDDYQTITSQAGTHAYLPCNVKQLVKKPISWLRVRDGHILTVDQTTFIADQRFQSIYTINPERWSLQIKYVQLKDAGIYECQVSTEPKASAIVYLHVVEPKTELIGAPTRHVKAGSQVKLLCIISQALEPPLFINWFYNQKQIYLHNHKGWHTEIERIELPPETTTTTTTTTSKTTTTTSKTTTPTTATSTTTGTSTTLPSSSSTSSSSLKLSSTSSSMLNGSEIPAMHVFTSIQPQQTLNYGNLLELVSESTYNNHTNLIQPEAASSSIMSSPRTEQNQRAASTVGTAVETTSTTITTAKSSSPAALQETTTFYDITDVNNNNNNSNDDDDDGDDDEEYEFKTNPSPSTFEGIAAQRGYMMLSSLMTFTDVKQITTASLIIPSVQKQDSGNYTCSPSNSEPRTVILHVLNGEYSASAITSAAINSHVIFNIFIFKFSIFTMLNKLLQNSAAYNHHLIEQYSGG